MEMSNTYLRSESSTLFSSGEGVRSSGWCASSLAPLFATIYVGDTEGQETSESVGVSCENNR